MNVLPLDDLPREVTEIVTVWRDVYLGALPLADLDKAEAKMERAIETWPPRRLLLLLLALEHHGLLRATVELHCQLMRLVRRADYDGVFGEPGGRDRGLLERYIHARTALRNLTARRQALEEKLAG